MSGSDIETAFTGRIANDRTQRDARGSGKPWLSFSVAVGEGDAVTFVNVALFGPTVPKLAPRLVKGTRVYVEGKIRLNTWTASDGTPRAGLAVSNFHVVPLFQLGERRPKEPRDDRSTEPHERNAPAASFDQSIPF